MKLISLKLRNFKGAREVDFIPNGQDATVSGENASGKTTLVDAENWLLWGKDSLGSAQFEIKTKENGEVIHFLEHSVEGEFELESGKRITFKKIYKEEWTRPTGQIEQQMTSHTTVYQVNGVGQLKKQYDEEVANICSPTVFRELSDPMYMPSVMPWRDLRNRLFDRFSDVSDAEVILTTPELQDQEGILGLAAVMGDTPMDKFRAGLTQKRTEINKELAEIPIKIRTIDDGMKAPLAEFQPFYGEDGKTVITLEGAKLILTKLQEARAASSTGGAIAEKQTEILNAKNALADIEFTLKSAVVPVVSDNRRQQNIASQDTLKAEISRKNFAISEGERLITGLETEMAELRTDWTKIDKEVFTPSASDTCPTCQQPLPADQVEEANAKALSDFNLAKSKRLENNESEGKRKGERKATLDTSKKKAEEELLPIQAKLKAIEEEFVTLPDPVTQVVKAVDVTMDEGWQQANAKIAPLEEELAQLKSGATNKVAEIDEQIKEVQTHIAAMEERAREAAHRVKETARKTTLAERQKELAKEHEEIQRQAYMCDTFTRVKSSMLTEQINSKFTMANFVLFKELIGSDGLEECCIVTVDGVEYPSLNHGKKVNVGLDIINVMGEAMGFSPPIFVDFAESLTSWIPVNAQLIKLKAVEGVKELQFS